MTAKKKKRIKEKTEEGEEKNGEEVAAGGKQDGREGCGRMEEKNEVMVLGGEFVSAF